MTAEPKAMSAEERALDLWQWFWARFTNMYERGAPIVMKHHAPTDRPAEHYALEQIRAAEAEARRQAWLEAARWAKEIRHGLRQVAYKQRPTNDVLLRDAEQFGKVEARFRSLASRQGAEEKEAKRNG